MLQMPQSVYDRLRRYGETTYPHESCGILIGYATPEGNVVMQAIPVENAAPSPRNRYQIAPADLIRIERDSRAQNQKIVGFYHSHPDHPARPSATDLAEAHWLGCSYFITAIKHGLAAETQSFRLAGSKEEDKHFEAEEIRFADYPRSNLNPDGV
jgi:proteasome lid subunit RPN8/RPN11